MKKKPVYIFKKYDAMAKSDPIACAMAEEDEESLAREMARLHRIERRAEKKKLLRNKHYANN